MGNQEKAAKGDTVMATSTRLFKERVVKMKEKRRVFTVFNPVVVLSTILGEHLLSKNTRRQ
jgi:aconitate hydratase 2/2-methylisocitrate dehydratase